MSKYVCIHGHFYQPPRENAWLETVELQDSASPYHDWNERVTAECYAPNATARILDDKCRIARITNNYSKISFNFGPTLLAWMKRHGPKVYEAILAADRKSQQFFSGHGAGLAQAYNHMILPLANRRDKYTQIRWAIRDFEHRFGRRPEGMWLPETAVDLESLDILAEFDIRFTILAPHQAAAVRPDGRDSWEDVRGGKIDPTVAYRLRLPSGRQIALFFYDGPISRAIAFERLLASGAGFVERLTGRRSVPNEGAQPPLIHVATDGETYGHHHRFGDMALAFALLDIESKAGVNLTIYGEYLQKHPPRHEVRILENTSWSCTHGVERWRSDCGCSTGAKEHWRQHWRAPLREALDWLRDTIAPLFEREAHKYLKDPWEARNDYIDVVLDRSFDSIGTFLGRHASRPLTHHEKMNVLKLLELQRHAMFMYTSCGWFFDDLSGIETVQLMQYAGRALQLTAEVAGEDHEAGFLTRLEKAKSNMAERGDGRRIYERFVRPAMVDFYRVCAHYAISSLFESYGRETSVYCYSVDRQDVRKLESGKVRLAVGKARFTSQVVGETRDLCFGVLHWGDHNLNCGVGRFENEETYVQMVNDVSEPFAVADFPESIRRMDRHFGRCAYSLRSLFRDEQRKVVNRQLQSNLASAEVIYRQVYENNAPLMRFLNDCGVPIPEPLRAAAEVVLNASLRRAFEQGDLEDRTIRPLLAQARLEGVKLDTETLEFTLRKTLERIATALLASPEDARSLQILDDGLRLLETLPFQVELRDVQNTCYELLQSAYPAFRKQAQQENGGAKEWLAHFESAGRRLFLRLD